MIVSIKFFNTKQFGQIVGDLQESIIDDGVFKINKAAYVQLQQDPQTGQVGSAMMAVMTAFVEDDVLVLTEDDVVGGVAYTPSQDIYNQYQERFGTGLIMNASPLIK